MSIDTEELRRLAEAAGGDEWHQCPDDECLSRSLPADGDHGYCTLVADVHTAWPKAVEPAERAFIEAANPATVLALLDEIDELNITIHGGCGCPAPYDQCPHHEPLLPALNAARTELAALRSATSLSIEEGRSPMSAKTDYPRREIRKDSTTMIEAVCRFQAAVWNLLAAIAVAVGAHGLSGNLDARCDQALRAADKHRAGDPQ